MDVLNSDKSPYKNLGKNETNKLTDAINSIDEIVTNEVGRPIYQFVKYTPEPEEFQRIENIIEQFKTINPELHSLCLSYKC